MTALDRASILECFRPPIPESDEAAVLAEVDGLVSDLREVASRIGPDGRLAFAPITAGPNESDEDYAARTQAIFSRPMEGCPPDRLLFVLVVWVRDLLIKHGCAHGVPKDEKYFCGLTQLVEVVNRLAGKPCALKSGALRRFAAADRASSLINQLEFRAGHPIQLVRFKDGVPGEPEPLQGEARKQAEAMLREAEVKPPKRPRPHGQKRP